MTSPLVDIAKRLRDAGRAAFWRGEGAHAIMSQIADEIEALAASEPERSQPRPAAEQRGDRRRAG